MITYIYIYIYKTYTCYICKLYIYICVRVFYAIFNIYIYVHYICVFVYMCVCSVYIHIFIYLFTYIERFTCVSGTLREYVYYVDCLKGCMCLFHERLEARNAANSLQIKSRGATSDLYHRGGRGIQNVCGSLWTYWISLHFKTTKLVKTFDKIKGGWRSDIYTP